MSFHYARAGVYTCDEGCGAKELSASGDLPDGWTEWKREQFRNQFVALYIGHRCPACTSKAAEDRT